MSVGGTNSYLRCIVGFVDGFVSNVEVQVVDSSYEPPLGLFSNTGRLLDGDTW